MSRSMQQCMLVVLLCALAAVAHGRSLKQDDALSNSNGCLDTIPKCEAGACATRNVMGNARWVCLRCLANFEPVVTADGQDNIVQCVCGKGYFLNSTDPNHCTRCAQNQYCPGGDKVENPTTLGGQVTCGTGLVTRNTGARSQADCVAPAGYAMTSPSEATACARSSYAPPYNRLAKCLRCQSGLEEPSDSGLVDGDRDSKKKVCMVPPGRYMSQGLVRICPQGFYRETYRTFTDPLAQVCVACNPGITTTGAGATSAANCSRVLPGYGIGNVQNVTATDQSNIPALPQNETTGLPTATVCSLGYYSAGGYCAACPQGTVTRQNGSQTIEACVVPPGYYLPASGSMSLCSSNTFREGWVMFSDVTAKTCTQCGDQISGEPRDLDENPLAANGSLVQATPTSCFIEPGQGMFAVGKNLFAAKDCPANTYGVAGRVYGWAAAPCKPCPRNMITDGLSKVNNSDVCVNDDGFGYASEGASRCAPGFYSAKGSRKPCQQCPFGRTTEDLASKQRYITECIVKPGFGIVNSTDNATDPWNPTPGADLLPVLECPVGYYGGGGAIDSKCIPCPAGSTTAGTGAVNATECSVCIAGYGMQDGSSSCTPCNYGTFQAGGFPNCTACIDSTFYAPVDGKDASYTSQGTTLYKGSKSADACVPKKTQMSPEAGQAFFTPTTNATRVNVTASSFTACVNACPADTCCFAQFEGGICSQARLTPEASSATTAQFVYKLPPSTLVGASSVDLKAKMMSSGYYAHCAVSDVDAWLTVGSNLNKAAKGFGGKTAQWDNANSKADCKKKCDNSNICIGFITQLSGTQLQCSYRGGVDSLNSRAFFSLPTAASINVDSFGW